MWNDYFVMTWGNKSKRFRMQIQGRPHGRRNLLSVRRALNGHAVVVRAPTQPRHVAGLLVFYADDDPTYGTLADLREAARAADLRVTMYEDGESWPAVIISPIEPEYLDPHGHLAVVEIEIEEK